MRSRVAALALLAALVAAAPAAAGFRFAPYVDVSGYPPPNLGALRTGGGIHAATLGFVVARGGTDCVPSWGGYAAYPASGAQPYRRANVRAFTRAGGGIVVSFGGQAGTELASVCPTPAALAGAYRAVLSAYGAKHADFDIEGAAVADHTAAVRRAQAIATLEHADRALKVSYTLPVLPSGLDAGARAIVRTALANGQRIDVVNVMAMDYGADAAPNPAGHMATYAISAAKATARQLHRSLSHIGVTPMIGVNDVQSEVFTLADARRLTRWSKAHKLGMLAMWEAGRDRQCAQPSSSAQTDCSSVAQSPFAFSHALEQLTG